VLIRTNNIRAPKKKEENRKANVLKNLAFLESFNSL